MITAIPDCPSCGSDNTFTGIDDPGLFGCLACGFAVGPDDNFLEPAEEADEEPVFADRGFALADLT